MLIIKLWQRYKLFFASGPKSYVFNNGTHEISAKSPIIHSSFLFFYNYHKKVAANCLWNRKLCVPLQSRFPGTNLESM